MEYELVREIKNLCRNNQMLDIFFDEIECADPEHYVRELLKGKQIKTTFKNKECVGLVCVLWGIYKACVSLGGVVLLKVVIV